MLKSQLLHPDILRALAGAGHGAQVLIADGNYPSSTGSAPAATRVYLNLAPGLITATDALRVLATAIPVEAAHVMQNGRWLRAAYLRCFSRPATRHKRCSQLKRFAFYAQASQASDLSGNRNRRTAYLRQHPADHRCHPTCVICSA